MRQLCKRFRDYYHKATGFVSCYDFGLATILFSCIGPVSDVCFSS